MPVSSADYDINVKSTADLEALQKTITALEKIKAAQIAAGKDTSQVEGLLDLKKAELERGKAADEANQKNIKGTEDLTLGHRELREAVGAVGRQFGGLADVGLWLNPTTAALAALLAAVEGVKKVFEQLQAPVDAFNPNACARRRTCYPEG